MNKIHKSLIDHDLYNIYALLLGALLIVMLITPIYIYSYGQYKINHAKQIQKELIDRFTSSCFNILDELAKPNIMIFQNNTKVVTFARVFENCSAITNLSIFENLTP